MRLRKQPNTVDTLGTAELLKMRDEVSLITKHRVTRVDYLEAVIEALLDTHEELRNHPEVVDFHRREAEMIAAQKATDDKS